MDFTTENNSEINGEEYRGEEYIPDWVCIKRNEDEETFESDTSCSEAHTTTGNILHRMIKDPTGRRTLCLGKWPSYTSKSETDVHENFHQFRAAQQSNVLKQMCSLRVTSEPNIFRQPAIIATIGPSCADVINIFELLSAGVNIVRVNMAHINPCNIREPFLNIIEANNRLNTMKDYEVPIATMLDLKGPEIRTGKIDPACCNENTSEIQLQEGAFIRLTSEKVFEERCTDKIIYVNYAGLINQVLPGNLIYIADGKIKLLVNAIESKRILCSVANGGTLKNLEKVHIPMLPVLLPLLSDFDIECLELAVSMNVDIVVVPATRNSETIKRVKKILGKEEEKDILVFAKISSYEGLENIDSILTVADGIVIQKNDLCLEIFPEKSFIAEKEIIGKCNRLGKPVLCTAELSSQKMGNHITKRMEANDISNAIIDGADGIILIKETALEDDGLEIVGHLSDIMREAEAVTMQKPFIFDLSSELIPSIEPSKAIALAAVQICNKIQASAILTITSSGKTARLLSWFRPRRPVIAITRVGKVARQMNLWRAVFPLQFSAPPLTDWFQDCKARFEYGISYGKSLDIIKSGDLLVLVSGYRKKAGFTNCIRIVFASVQQRGFAENVSTYYEEASKEGSVNQFRN